MHRIRAEQHALYSSVIKYLREPDHALARLSIRGLETSIFAARLLDVRAPLEASGDDLIASLLISLAARAAFVVLRAHHVTRTHALLVYPNALHHAAARLATVNASVFTAL
jgi:hypothetical protein